MCERESACGVSVKRDRVFGELLQDKQLPGSFFHIVSSHVHDLDFGLKFSESDTPHLLHFAAASAVPCGWESSAHALCGADSSALTCLL